MEGVGNKAKLTMLRLEAHFPSSCADISCQRKCPQHLYWMKLNSAVLLQRFPEPDRMAHFIWNMIWQAEVHNVMLQFIQAKLSYPLNKAKWGHQAGTQSCVK